MAFFDFGVKDLVTTGVSALGALQRNREARGASRRMMDFQREMSNTRYQRAVRDLRAAGLNPYLLYSGGQPAPVPSGSTYNPVDVGTTAMSSGLASHDATTRRAGAHTARADMRIRRDMHRLQRDRLREDVKTMKANRAELHTRRAKHAADASLAYTRAETERRVGDRVTKETERLMHDIKHMEERLVSAKAAASEDRWRKSIYDGPLGPILKHMQVFSEALSGVGGAARKFAPSPREAETRTLLRKYGK